MPGKSFNGRTYYPVPGSEQTRFRKKDRAEDQARRLRRSGYFARIAEGTGENAGYYVIYACTKHGCRIPRVWKRIEQSKERGMTR